MNIRKLPAQLTPTCDAVLYFKDVKKLQSVSRSGLLFVMCMSGPSLLVESADYCLTPSSILLALGYVAVHVFVHP